MSSSLWLDNSEDSIFFAPSGNIPSRPSADSLDLNAVPFLDDYPSLLLASTSLESLPLNDYNPIKPPPCPATSPRRTRTRHAFVSLGSSLVSPKDSRPNRRYTNVLVSSPTAARLRCVPHLRPTLKNWITSIPGSDPPDMAPWTPTRERLQYTWIPEGSCLPPDYLKHRFRSRHGTSETLLLSGSDDPRPPVASEDLFDSSARARPLRRRASHSMRRDPLVMELAPHRIPTPSQARNNSKNGKQRRWSVSLPPSYLSAEFITRRLELQRHDAIMKSHVTQSDASTDALPLPVPAIKVTTSTASIAVMAPGSPETPILSLEPLAVRRGQKMLVPLTLNVPKPTASEPVEDDYPGIPTAFLGTPSAYSPSFQFSSSTTKPGSQSLGINDMISSLRSQVASLKPPSPAEASIPVPTVPPSPTTPESAASSDAIPSISGDDWAFANDLMWQYGNGASTKTPSNDKPIQAQQQTPSIRKSLASSTRLAKFKNKARRASVPAAISTPKNRPKSNMAPRTDLTKPRHSTGTVIRSKIAYQTSSAAGTSSKIRTTPGPSPWLLSPTTPATPSPSPAATCDSPSTSSTSSGSQPSSSAKRPQGILKPTKSVRFADIPKKDKNKDDAPSRNQPPEAAPKRRASTPSRQPSPLRASFALGQQGLPALLTGESQQGSAAEKPTRAPTNKRSASQPPPTPSSRLMTLKAQDAAGSPSPAPSSKVATPRRTQRSGKAFSLLTRESDKEKENTPTSMRNSKRGRRYTHSYTDENAARRAADGEGESRKHKLSSSFRFLGRWRA
ncbi:hypothetical protein BC834DRAFT_856389 [Gloeopeniophorella convolvens]|nr:hypothetical protein BC834DRAFT_856389 [Gloeopeniophorella convolvens]